MSVRNFSFYDNPFNQKAIIRDDLTAVRELVVAPQAGDIPALVGLLNNANIFTKRYAARALMRLAWNNSTNQEAIRLAGGIPLLIKLLKSNDVLNKRNAAWALANLLWNNPTNQDAIVQAENAPDLAACLESTDVLTREYAETAINNLIVRNSCKTPNLI